MAYPCILYDVPSPTDSERTAATMEFVSWILPTAVTAGVPFDIQVVYKLKTIELRDFNGNIAAHFPTYDGMWLQYLNPIHTAIEYWIWRLSQMGLSLWEGSSIPAAIELMPGEIVVNLHQGTSIMSGALFTYNWSGTIEQLLGRAFPNPATINLRWSMFGQIYGWHEPSDWYPWDWDPPDEFVSFSRVAWLSQQIQVSPPAPPAPPPYPIINTDESGVSKTVVSPTEQFTLKVTIENQNESAGPYHIGYYFETNYYELATGTIAGKATVSKQFTYTANMLSHRTITESQILSFTVVIRNAEGETDRTTYAIDVIVTDGGGGGGDGGGDGGDGGGGDGGGTGLDIAKVAGIGLLAVGAILAIKGAKNAR